MSCCGRSRNQFRPAPTRTVPQSGTVVFEYTGMSRLTVIGPVTRKRYEFARPGTRLQVDSRDSSAVAGVPGLRRV